MTATSNKDLMTRARETLKGNWGIAIGAYILFTLVQCGCQVIPYLGGIALLVIQGPLMLGLMIFFLALSREEERKVNMLFDGFEQFTTALFANLLIAIYTFLWFLLLIVPGIIASLAYSQTFFILADNKELTASEAIRTSKQMMDGYKLKFAYLQCRFIGWALLCILTFGIGFLWLYPYTITSFALFYEDVKHNFLEQQAHEQQFCVSEIPPEYQNPQG